MPTDQPTRESKNEETLSAAQEKPLEESLADASVLLWYAAREGKQVTEKTISDIVLAQSSLRAGTRDTKIEGRFWVALRELAAAIRPASIDSILATYSYPFGQHGQSGKRRLVDAAATKKKYSFLALGVLGSLLIFQILWFVGTTWSTDLAKDRSELDGIAGSLREMIVDGKAADDLQTEMSRASVAFAQELSKIKQTDTSQDKIPTGINPATSKDARTHIEDVINALRERNGKKGLEYANNTLRADRLEAMLDGNVQALALWDYVTVMFTGNFDTFKHKESKPLVRNWMDLHDVNRLKEEVDVLEKEQLGVEDILIHCKSKLAILSQYVLPLLYGWLGSLAYILRTLSSEIQNVTFTRGSEIRYSIRWPLGMLGGVTVGLFFDPAQFPGLAVVTPLGLSFLAGYGVELLFTGLDGMVGAFTGGSTARPT